MIRTAWRILCVAIMGLAGAYFLAAAVGAVTVWVNTQTMLAFLGLTFILMALQAAFPGETYEDGYAEGYREGIDLVLVGMDPDPDVLRRATQ